MPNTHTGTIIVLAAGTMTFANEWFQDPGNINWRVPVATLLGAGAIDLVAHLDNGAAIALASLIFIGAAVTPFNGKSVADEISSNLLTAPNPLTKKKGKSSGRHH